MGNKIIILTINIPLQIFKRTQKQKEMCQSFCESTMSNVRHASPFLLE